jgi:lambda repressor-like predicted transcriptional regulator
MTAKSFRDREIAASLTPIELDIRLPEVIRFPRSKDRGLNMKKKPTHERVRRELTAEERKRLALARKEVEAAKAAILAEGRNRKKAWEAMRQDARAAIADLKAERERRGLSLADIETRSGLKRSALSRLENDPTANPTMLTLQRYALALGMSVATKVLAGK